MISELQARELGHSLGFDTFRNFKEFKQETVDALVQKQLITTELTTGK